MLNYNNTSIFLILYLLFPIQSSAQESRGFYTQKFNDNKRAIDSLASASLGTIGSIIGYIFDEPYYGVFPEDHTLREMNFSFKERTFSKGDTFFIRNVTYPRFNYSIGVGDTSIEYHSSNYNPELYLFEPSTFATHLKKLKSLDIDYILPLWGVTYCNTMDDNGIDNKMEKWWLKTASHSIFYRLERTYQKYTMTIDLRYSVNDSGDDLKYLGCSIPDSSHIEFQFTDDTRFRAYHNGDEENCSSITIDFSKNISLLKNRLQSITIALSKNSETFQVKSKVEGDVLFLKCDCLE